MEDKTKEILKTAIHLMRDVAGDGGYHTGDCMCDETDEKMNTRCIYCEIRDFLGEFDR